MEEIATCGGWVVEDGAGYCWICDDCATDATKATGERIDLVDDDAPVCCPKCGRTAPKSPTYTAGGKTFDGRFPKKFSIRGNMILRSLVMYGNGGPQRGYRGGTGTKVHRLFVEEVVGVVGDPATVKRGTYADAYLRAQNRPPARERIYYSVRANCNGNGQHTGRPFEHLTAADVTCAKCSK